MFTIDKNRVSDVGKGLGHNNRHLEGLNILSLVDPHDSCNLTRIVGNEYLD
jgi:hypothetical protein